MIPPEDSDQDSKPISSEMARMILLCALVGVIAGLGAIAFFVMLDGARWFFLELLAGYAPGGPAGEPSLFPETSTNPRRWVLFIMPAAGGLMSGWLIYRFAPEAAGHGTDAAIESYHFRAGAVRARVPLIKAITAALTIGTGGSGGREGPIAQIGAGFGSILAERLKLTPHERRTLMAAGMGAGIGAIFSAPLAGALFASEVLYKGMDLEHEVLVPAFISSIVAYSVFAVMLGWDPVFATPDFVFNSPIQLIPYAALAALLALCVILFIKIFYRVHHGFNRWKIPNHFKPAIGGLAVGCIGLMVPDAMATSYGVIQGAFDDPQKLGIKFLLLVAFGKMLTTSFAIGTGGSGGVFGPSLVIGGALGGAFGLFVQAYFPQFGVDPGAFVVVGMAGFFAGAANCPISTIIMVSEMTGNYHLLVPSMLVCIFSYLLCQKHSLYEKQLGSRMDAPSKMGNMLSAVLRKILVREALPEAGNADLADQFITIDEAMTLKSLVNHFTLTEQQCFPIVDREGKLTGMVDARDVRGTLGEDVVAELVVARDLAKPAVTITLDDSLLVAVRKMNLSGEEEVIVVDRTKNDQPIASLNYRCVVQAYDHALFSGQTRSERVV